MKRKRYSIEQIVAAVKQHDIGLPAGDIARKLGIAEQTFYRWKKQYGALEATEVRELTQLREENTKRKKLVAELSLDKAMRRKLRQKSGERPRAPGHNIRMPSEPKAAPNGTSEQIDRKPVRQQHHGKVQGLLAHT